MHKLLTLLPIVATLLFSGCSTHKIPGVYRPTIQQGNVVTQEQVNQLQPEMSKHQVKFILGTPLLIDVFHQDRWDYLYTMETNDNPRTQERIVLFFQDDRLIRIEGDYRPKSVTDPLAEQKNPIYTVPDYKDRDKGLLGKAMETVGLGGDEPPLREPVEPAEAREGMVTAAEAEATAPEQSAAPVEQSSTPPESPPAVDKRTEEPVDLLNERATTAAPVDELPHDTDNPTGE